MTRARNRRTSRLIASLAAGLSLLAAALLLDGRDAAPPLEAEGAVTDSVADGFAGEDAGAQARVRGDEYAGAARTDAETVEEVEEEEVAERILVSLEEKRLWFVRGRDTLLNAPVAIGKGQDFEFEGRKYHFSTPRGQRRVVAKAENPIWTVPEWHYYEKAVHKKLAVVKLEKDMKVRLRDGSFIVVVEDQVGRVNPRGYFNPFTPGNEIIFDGRIFIPPMESVQRKVPDALGPYKLDMGDGYLIHGTHMYNEDSIGEAVSHGCIRMDNGDLERLYELAPRGTAIEIF